MRVRSPRSAWPERKPLYGWRGRGRATGPHAEDRDGHGRARDGQQRQGYGIPDGTQLRAHRWNDAEEAHREADRREDGDVATRVARGKASRHEKPDDVEDRPVRDGDDVGAGAEVRLPPWGEDAGAMEDLVDDQREEGSGEQAGENGED